VARPRSEGSIGYVGYRWLTRGERGSRLEALATIVGGEG
jgi:hypothetical protein